MSASSLYPYIVPAMQYFAAVVYSGVAQNWVGAGYVAAGVVLYGLTWLVWLIAFKLEWAWLGGSTGDSLQFTANAFSTGSLTAFAVYWALFMWEQYGNNKGTTMGLGIGAGYLLTIGMIVMSVNYFTGNNNLALIGLMVLLGTGVAVGAYYATKAVEPNQELYANPSSLTFLLAAILTPAVLGVSAMLYGASAGANNLKNVDTPAISKMRPGYGLVTPPGYSNIGAEAATNTNPNAGIDGPTSAEAPTENIDHNWNSSNTESNDFRKQKITNNFLNASKSSILGQKSP